MRRGFAIVELPLVILLFLAVTGGGLLVHALVRHGAMTAQAWVGAALIAPFLLAVTWLWASHPADK